MTIQSGSIVRYCINYSSKAQSLLRIVYNPTQGFIQPSTQGRIITNGLRSDLSYPTITQDLLTIGYGGNFTTKGYYKMSNSTDATYQNFGISYTEQTWIPTDEYVANLSVTSICTSLAGNQAIPLSALSIVKSIDSKKSWGIKCAQKFKLTAVILFGHAWATTYLPDKIRIGTYSSNVSSLLLPRVKEYSVKDDNDVSVSYSTTGIYENTFSFAANSIVSLPLIQIPTNPTTAQFHIHWYYCFAKT